MRHMTKMTVGIWMTSFALSLAISFAAHAETSKLKIDGDLMIHPSQLENLLQTATEKIRASANWNWPELQFSKPYKTSWTDVQARGPFDMVFSTENLKNQEIGFELTWNDPAISVGQFQIDDTITRNVGGNTIIIHLAGQCTGMALQIPNAQWKVKGHLSWVWNGTSVEVKWRDFSFSMNESAQAQANLGQCDGPTGLQPALQQAIDAISHDQNWLQDVLRDGVLNWVENSLGTLQVELLKPRTISLKPGLDAQWEPVGLSGAANGRVRIAGHLELMKASTVSSETKIERDYSEASLDQVEDSGFVLPKKTLQGLLDFAFKSGELQYRVNSDKVDAFQKLMQSRLLQFFVWPSLMEFAKNTLFYFDVTTAAAPQLGTGSVRAGKSGVIYPIAAPLVVHQWAPVNHRYVPYVDFKSPLSGQLNAYVSNQNLVLQMQPNGLHITSLFRREFFSLKNISQRLAASILSRRVENYLSEKTFSIPLPAWHVGDGMTLEISDIQAWKQSLRVPLRLKNSK